MMILQPHYLNYVRTRGMKDGSKLNSAITDRLAIGIRGKGLRRRRLSNKLLRNFNTYYNDKAKGIIN